MLGGNAMKDLMLYLSASLAISVLTAAQSDPRSQSPRHRIAERSIHEYGYLAMEDHSSTLTWTAEVPHPDGQGGYAILPVVTATLSFDRPGSVVRLSASRYLVSGFASASQVGHLVLVELVRAGPRALTTVADIPWIGKDPRHVAWNRHEGALYLWEATAGELFRVPMPAATSLPSLGSLTGPCSAGSVPALGESGFYSMWSRSHPNPGVVLAPWRSLEAHGTRVRPRWLVSWSATQGWIGEPFSTTKVADADVVAAGYAILGGTFVPTGGPLLVKGPAGPVWIRDVESGANVWAGTMPALPNWWKTDDSDESTWHQFWFASGVLTAGRAYVLHDGSSAISRVFLPLLRHGVNTSLQNGAMTHQMDRGQLNGWEARIGNSDFGVDGRLVTTPVPDAELCFVYMLFGIHATSEPPPFLDVEGDLTVLSPTLGVLGPRVLFLDRSAERIGFRYSMPIPADPGLAGWTLYFQHASLLPGGVVVSDIFGTTILP